MKMAILYSKNKHFKIVTAEQQTSAIMQEKETKGTHSGMEWTLGYLPILKP
jgi:hypothetical protein